MFILGNFFIAAAKVIDIALPLFYWVIIIRAVLSWFSPDPYNPLVRFLYTATEPLLEPFRRLVPPFRLGIDISPLLAILTLYFLRAFFVTSLYQLGHMMR